MRSLSPRSNRRCPSVLQSKGEEAIKEEIKKRRSEQMATRLRGFLTLLHSQASERAAIQGATQAAKEEEIAAEGDKIGGNIRLAVAQRVENAAVKAAIMASNSISSQHTTIAIPQPVAPFSSASVVPRAQARYPTVWPVVQYPQYPVSQYPSAPVRVSTSYQYTTTAPNQAQSQYMVQNGVPLQGLQGGVPTQPYSFEGVPNSVSAQQFGVPFSNQMNGAPMQRLASSSQQITGQQFDLGQGQGTLNVGSGTFIPDRVQGGLQSGLVGGTIYVRDGSISSPQQ